MSSWFLRSRRNSWHLRNSLSWNAKTFATRLLTLFKRPDSQEVYTDSLSTKVS
uniref:Uncharacterized protein n=1 Tax=Rhizophora mucronata TaxID=61149 RepID=A0A2P2NJ57_RHIMU